MSIQNIEMNGVTNIPIIRTTLINAVKWVVSVWLVCEAAESIAKLIIEAKYG